MTERVLSTAAAAGSWGRELFESVLDLLVPSSCAGCEAPRVHLCADCRARLSGAGARRVRPDRPPPGLPEVHAAAPYAGPVRQLLLAHKERGALGLAAPLGGALAAAVRSALPGPGGAGGRGGPAWGGGPAGGPAFRGGPACAGPPGSPHAVADVLLLVPVPSTRASVRARGHDPMRRIGLAASRALRHGGVPARLLPALRLRRSVADQAGLRAEQRLRNMAGALAVPPRWEPALARGRVVLVDDVVTTGATLAEASRALAAAGADVLAAAVVAAPPRARSEPSPDAASGDTTGRGPRPPGYPG